MVMLLEARTSLSNFTIRPCNFYLGKNRWEEEKEVINEEEEISEGRWELQKQTSGAEIEKCQQLF